MNNLDYPSSASLDKEHIQYSIYCIACQVFFRQRKNFFFLLTNRGRCAIISLMNIFKCVEEEQDLARFFRELPFGARQQGNKEITHLRAEQAKAA